MKKTFLFSLLAAVLFFAACNTTENPEETEKKFSVDPQEINCPDVGGEYKVMLTSPTANKWTAQSDNAWVIVSPTEGTGDSEVRIKISANKESAESTSKVTFTDGKSTIELPITRAAKAAPQLRVVSEKEINTPREGGTYTIQIESNIQWQVDKSANWVTLDKGMGKNNGSVTVTIEASKIPETTTATVTVSQYAGSGTDAQVITITRGGTDATSLSVDPVTIDAPSGGGSYTINVESNAKWKVYKTWDMDWVTLGSTEGDGNGSFGITVNEATSLDPATGVITIEEKRDDSYRPVTVQVTVNREGKAKATLSIDPSTPINAPASGGKYPITIKSNYPWTATTNTAKYISLSTNSGDGDGTLVVTVKPATTEEEITAKVIISVKSNYGNEQAVISIHRAGKQASVLEVQNNKIEATYKGTVVTVNITSNTTWKAATSNPKVATVSPELGSKKGVITITVLPATDTEKSSARITLTTDDGAVSRQIIVSRNGMPESKYVAKLFSISSTKKIHFSRGNLQYQAATDTWRFAEHQFNFVGDDKTGNVYVNGIKSDNAKIGKQYDGWIDLFGWGTGNKPILAEENDSAYKIFTDWGVNKILNGGNQPNQWRTLTIEEWQYMANERMNAKKLRGAAIVNDIRGLIILPDEWLGSTYLPFTATEGDMFGNLNDEDYKKNVYTIEQWQQMEAAGAVFLPCAGLRNGTTVIQIGLGSWRGYYSTSSEKTDSDPNVVFAFCTNNPYMTFSGSYYTGRSVRLVK